MNTNIFLELSNGTAVPADRLVNVDFSSFRSALSGAISSGCRVLDLFAEKCGGDDCQHRLICILGDPKHKQIKLASTMVGSSYDALTSQMECFRFFERDIAERTGIIPAGHPALKPLRFIRNSGIYPDAWGRSEILPGDAVCKELGGTAAHEVAVGPVHAGVIEPGHFRFQCFGEEVHRLEIFLGYQHRGLEKLVLSSGTDRALRLLENAAGDSSAAYAWCFSQLIEALSGAECSSPAASALRIVSAILERIANNTGTLGALAGDVAFLPTSSFCGRIRGDYLNLTAELAGNRFGRGFILPGGTRYGADRERRKRMIAKLKTVGRELEHALNLMFDSPSVLDRLENLGTVSKEDAVKFGITGAAGRACGLTCDARHDFPPVSGSIEPYPQQLELNGSVLSRALIYRAEALGAAAEAQEILESGIDLDSGYFNEVKPLLPEMLSVSVIEAWRGEVVQFAATGSDGKISSFRSTDPSLHNWRALEIAMKGTQISDFPICNKSFNLSYCGVDL